MSGAKDDNRMPTDKSIKLDLAPVAPQSFRRTDRIERWRFWAPLALVVLLVLWRTADAWLLDTPGRVWHSPGPLATAHALYDNQCSVCHAPFTPVDASNWLAVGLNRTHAADGKCTQCHEGANHHATEKAGIGPACSSCHREHGGREAMLARTPDATCTSCHSNLHKFVADGATAQFANVTRFAKDQHPEFRPLVSRGADTRKLKFNHKLHLTPGFRRAEGGDPFTLEMVDPRYQNLYGSAAGKKEPVQLECKSCHQLDSRDFPMPASVLETLPQNAVMPARPPGATMLPIVYEQHCQACHPLSFESSAGGANALTGVVTPHRQQPSEIRKYLETYYFQKLEKERTGLLNQPFPPLPGKDPSPEQRAFSAVLDAQVQRAEQQLYLGKKVCGECHYTTTPLANTPPNRLAELKIAPTTIPEVWYTHANFTHTPHRQLNCQACHESANSRDEMFLSGTNDPSLRPLLPGVENCLKCHSSSSPGGGARQDCVSCHRYHNGDHPLSGKGAADRAGPNAGKRTILEFLDPGKP